MRMRFQRLTTVYPEFAARFLAGVRDLDSLSYDALYARLTGYDPAPLFGWAAVQRLAQALGAFARLGAQPATARFAAHIPSALAMMRRALTRTGGLPALRALVDRTLATPLP